MPEGEAHSDQARFEGFLMRCKVEEATNLHFEELSNVEQALFGAYEDLRELIIKLIEKGDNMKLCKEILVGFIERWDSYKGEKNENFTSLIGNGLHFLMGEVDLIQDGLLEKEQAVISIKNHQ